MKLRLSGVLLVATASLLVASCNKGGLTYNAGPPSSISGEPLVADPKASCTTALGAWFDRADRNKDGLIDLVEAKADGETFFAAVDVDGNGLMTPSELTDYRVKTYPREYRGSLATPLPPPKTPPKTPDGTPLPDPELRRYLTTPAVADQVMAADQNLDFQVSREEFTAKLVERGARLDANGDGKLSRDEILAGCRPG